jgi:CheY-like chemotaxis protein
MHGGTVKAESPGEGKGATFTVSLPLLQDASPSIPDEQNHPVLLGSNSLPLAGVKVLIVEDDADSRDFVVFVLEQDGAEVMAVSSAFEALQVLAQTKLDVLVSDIGMPDMDGYTLIRQVRTLSPEEGGQIPAIALTAFARNYDEQRALSAGFQMHLSKPLNADKLVAAVVRLVTTGV